MSRNRFVIGLVVSIGFGTATFSAPPKSKTATENLSTAAVAQTTDWPQFLGPRRDGTSTETGLKLDWRDKPPSQLWKVTIGAGFSSPIIVGQRIYTMVNRGDRDWVICLKSTDGSEVWSRDAAAVYLDPQRQGPGPRATPAYDEGTLFCLFPAGELLAVAADSGTVLWQINILQASGAKGHDRETFYWGLSGSPLIEGNLVIVQPGGDHNNSLVAFDKRSGKTAWGAGSDPQGYGSAISVDSGGQRQIIACAGQSFFGVSPRDGKPLWRYAFGNKYDCNCATPVWTDQGLFVSSAYGVGAALVELKPGRGQWQSLEVWRNKDLQNHFTTSMIVDGHIYGSHGDLRTVTFRCLELASGKTKWVERGPGKCNLIAVDGHLIYLNERGTLGVIKADPERYQPLGDMPALLTYKCWTPPAL